MANQTREMFAKILVIMLKELQCWMNEYLTTLLKSFGIEATKLQGMLSGQSAPDPYLVMGLEKSASNDEVKIRYRELVRKLHPDTAGVKGTTYFFNLVMVAYQMIKAERGWK
jgi:DnaJ-class molecular chaperone